MNSKPMRLNMRTDRILLISAVCLQFSGCKTERAKMLPVKFVVVTPYNIKFDSITVVLNSDSIFRVKPTLMFDGTLEFVVNFPIGKTPEKFFEVKEFFHNCTLEKIELEFGTKQDYSKYSTVSYVEVQGCLNPRPNENSHLWDKTYRDWAK